MPLNPSLSAAYRQFQFAYRQLETLPEIVLNPVTDNTAEIVVKVLRSIGSVKIFRMIDCQVKCNTIREKNFEAPRRESEN